MANKPKVISIVGPTASGKTSLSIQIAQHFGGEVISADSRQVYCELNIGTGKVTTQEMAGVPHHLIDIIEMEEIYTGVDFKHDAAAAIVDIVSRDKTPIIAGGTFFYLDLLRGKMQAAPVVANHEFRDSLSGYTNEELLELLQQKDLRRAHTIEPHNRRRLVRALEIIHTLGSVPEQVVSESPYDMLILGIEIEKETLREKFAKRLAGWLTEGLVDEVTTVRARLSAERFLELGFEYTLTAEYIDQQITKEELFEKFVQKNWQYAKRQMTWLKRDKEIEWIDPSDIEPLATRVEKFLTS